MSEIAPACSRCGHLWSAHNYLGKCLCNETPSGYCGCPGYKPPQSDRETAK